MTDEDRGYIDKGFAGLKQDIKEYVDQVKEILLIRFHGVESDVKRNREDITDLKEKQDATETNVTKVTTKFDGHVENHADSNNNKRSNIALLISGLSLIAAVLIAVLSAGG